MAGYIARLVPLGSPGFPVDPEVRPKLEGGGEIDLAGMWVLPGFVDLYAHPQEPVEYYSKLWLSHGITTIRDPSCRDGMGVRYHAAASVEQEDTVQALVAQRRLVVICAARS